MHQWARWSLCATLALLCFGGCTANGPGNDRAGSVSVPPVAPPAPLAPPSAPSGSVLGGASRCRAADPALCEGFEAQASGAAPDPNVWTPLLDGDGRVEVDATRAARGSNSLHVHAPAKGFVTAMVETPYVARHPGVMFGRAFLYYEAPPTLPQAHWSLIVGKGTLPGQTATTEVRYGGQFGHLMANYYGQDQYQHAADNVNGSWINATAMPSGTWSCWEWEFAATGNIMRLWLDGTEVDKLAVNNISTQCCPNAPWTMPPFARLALGWQSYVTDPTQSGYDLWLDEIMLDGERIGCSR